MSLNTSITMSPSSRDLVYLCDKCIVSRMTLSNSKLILIKNIDKFIYISLLNILESSFSTDDVGQ